MTVPTMTLVMKASVSARLSLDLRSLSSSIFWQTLATTLSVSVALEATRGPQEATKPPVTSPSLLRSGVAWAKKRDILLARSAGRADRCCSLRRWSFSSSSVEEEALPVEVLIEFLLRWTVRR